MKYIYLFLFFSGILSISNSLLAQVSIGGYNVYYGTIHNHTSISDGTGTVDQAYNYAKNVAHLDFFGLSDHDSFFDSTKWTATKTVADSYNAAGIFTTFRGFEWTSSNAYGHVTVVNSDNYCTTQSPTNTFTTLCDWLNQTECVAFFNHPGDENTGGLEFNHFSTTPTSKIVGMELWNINRTFSTFYYNDGYYPGDGNMGYYDEALQRNWKIGALGNDDNHVATWGTDNDYRMAVLCMSNTREDIYNAMKARRFYSTLDKNLALSFKINGSEMGSTILPGTYPIVIEASDADGELFTQVQLLKNGTVVNTWIPNVEKPDITLNLSFANNDYYYVRVKQTDGDEAISSPIWISDGNHLPVVSILSPSQSEVFDSAANIIITASATDPDGTIAKVDFYQGTALLGSDATFPYSFSWTNAPAGIYNLTAKATDNMGASIISSSISITVVTAGGPVTTSSTIATSMDDVEESSSGWVYTNSSDIELVYDSDNQTDGLRFTSLAIPKNAVISNAYIQFTSKDVTSGVCNLVIKGEAADNSSPFTTSSFNVSSRVKTTTAVTWTPGAWNTSFEASASERSPDISAIIQQIVSRSGYTSSAALTLIITGSGTRNSVSYDGVPAYAAKLFVTYTNQGSNRAPELTITNPLNSVLFTSPVSVAIDVSATDPDGTFSKVDFYQGTTLLGSDSTFPYSFSWANPPPGIFIITAKAIDNLGASTISAPVTITVTTSGGGTVTRSGSIATSSDDAEEAPSGWVNTGSSDIELVNDTGNAIGNQTVGLRFINMAIPQNALISSAYIQFTCNEKTTGTCNLDIRAEASDNSATFTTSSFNISSRPKTTSAVMWIPADWNTVSEATTLQRTPDLSSIIQQIVSRSGYTASAALSVIITGSGTRNSVSYDGVPALAAKLFVTYTDQGSNQAPVVTLTNPLNGVLFTSPVSVAINASATDPDGTISKVDFYQGTTLLGSDSSFPYTFSWANPATGTYLITAKATDNMGASTISTAISITEVNAGDPILSSSSIVTSTDDAEEAPSGWVNTGSSDIELVNDTGNAIGNQTVGLRFSKMEIPQNALISSAYIQFTCNEITTGTCILDIRAEASDNSSAFTSSSYNISSRPKTTSAVTWIPADWNTVSEATVLQRTPDISSIIQQIVSRSGYTASAALSVIITGNGTRNSVSYDGTPAKAARLVIEYMIPLTVKSAILESFKTKIETPKGILTCFPVPFKSQLNIQFIPIDAEMITSLELFNAAGKRVIIRRNRESQYVIDLGDLSRGVYMVKVLTNKGLYSKTVIKE